MINKILISFFLLSCNFLTLNAQSRALYFTSTKYTVLKANGSATNVSNNKKLYFHFYIDEANVKNGFIHISDDKKFYGADYGVEYKIYKIELKDNGKYYYWTKDVGQDGQIVLFVVDKNSSIPNITEHRYSPAENDNTVLKIIEYSID